mgnify:CR=1 FL=1
MSATSRQAAPPAPGRSIPSAAILSCSDSRVVPDLVFDQSPGDLFVVRLAGNFLDDDGLASLEYAVKFLGAPLLVVVGHTNCGAVAAAVKVVMERAVLPGHLPELIKAIEPAVIAAHARHPSDLVAAAIEENVKLNVTRMKDDKPILSDALAAKKIAAYGGVSRYRHRQGEFALMTVAGGTLEPLALGKDRSLSVLCRRRCRARSGQGSFVQRHGGGGRGAGRHPRSGSRAHAGFHAVATLPPHRQLHCRLRPARHAPHPFSHQGARRLGL